MSGSAPCYLLRFLADGVGAERRPGGHAHHTGGTGQGMCNAFLYTVLRHEYTQSGYKKPIIRRITISLRLFFN